MASCKSIREIYANFTIIVILNDKNKKQTQMLTFKRNNNSIENLFTLAFLRYDFYEFGKEKKRKIKVDIDCS